MVISLVLGIMGNAMSILAYASPMPTFWRIVRRRSVQEFKEQPYMLSLANGLLWMYYGAVKTKPDVMIISVNAAGCTFHYIYLVIFWAFACKRKKVWMTCWVACIHVAVATIVVALEIALRNILGDGDLYKSHHIRMFVAGIVAGLGSVLMFGSPLGIMGLVIKTKSVEYMPFLLSLSFFLRSGIWACYGFVIDDIFIEIPNTIGVLLAISQLVLYAIYKRILVAKPASKQSTMTIGLDLQGNIIKTSISVSMNNNAIAIDSFHTTSKKMSTVIPSIEGQLI